MIQGVTVADRIAFLAEKAGLFKFNLKKLLNDFLNDVQVVTEFEEYREQLLEIFALVMEKIFIYFPASEVYIVAHSEGTVVSFIGLLLGLCERRAGMGKDGPGLYDDRVPAEQARLLLARVVRPVQGE